MPIVSIESLSHTYPTGRAAVSGLSLAVEAGEIFAFLGPNGSGKSTTFKILSTLITPTSGTVTYAFPGKTLVLGPATVSAIRHGLGVVFQSPSLDGELTPAENLRHHAHLYGMRGAELSRKISSLLERFNLADRANDRVKTFSGGMKRRVEIAKSLLNSPPLLLLDEPSTGLDPAARIELWAHLRKIQAEGTTILVTTHLMEEADLATRLAIMDEGRCVAMGRPDELKSQISGDVLTLTTREPAKVTETLRARFDLASTTFDHTVRLEHPRAEFIPELVAALPNLVDSVSLSKPSLQDVFLRTTGRRFAANDA